MAPKDVPPGPPRHLDSRHRRIARAGGEGYVLHHQDLDDGQRTWWEGIPIVTAPTAISQCIETGEPVMAEQPAVLQVSLKPKGKPPTSARILDTWIVQAERAIGSEQSGRPSRTHGNWTGRPTAERRVARLEARRGITSDHLA